MEVACSDKHASLLRYGIKYDHKKFNVTNPWRCFYEYFVD
jgi:hypothetical protein